MLALAACQGVGPEKAIFGNGEVNPAGANRLVDFRKGPVSSAELATLICPEQPPPTSPAPGAPDPLVAALQCYDRRATSDPVEMIRRRNAVQYYLIMRSDQQCALWVTYIERAGAINRGTFNILSVLAGGAGAVVSGGAASILAGASGVASGTGAAIDAAMLHGLTEGLILPKVRQARARILQRIDADLPKDAIAYPLTRAVADALRYHAACNVSAALDETSPAAEFGAQLDALTHAAASMSTARAALAGARPAGDADIAPGAIFLTADRALLRVESVDQAAGKLAYLPLADAKPSAITIDRARFAAMVDGGTLIRPGG